MLHNTATHHRCPPRSVIHPSRACMPWPAAGLQAWGPQYPIFHETTHVTKYNRALTTREMNKYNTWPTVKQHKREAASTYIITQCRHTVVPGGSLLMQNIRLIDAPPVPHCGSQVPWKRFGTLKGSCTRAVSVQLAASITSIKPRPWASTPGATTTPSSSAVPPGRAMKMGSPANSWAAQHSFWHLGSKPSGQQSLLIVDGIACAGKCLQMPQGVHWPWATRFLCWSQCTYPTFIVEARFTGCWLSYMLRSLTRCY